MKRIIASALCLGGVLMQPSPRLVARADTLADALAAQRDFNAVQRVYLHGVPHTDKNGRPLKQYDPARSFFPIGAWGVPHSDTLDWARLKKAGFNTVWPWAVVTASNVLDEAKANGLQIILMNSRKADEIRRIKDHPNLLANVWMDEPTGRLGSTDMDKLFGEFTKYRKAVRKIAPDLPVFISDCAWIMPPAKSWWIKWNTAGDISCHDNYPIKNLRHRARSIGADPNGIPQSVALAVGSNREEKPVWLIVGAFEEPRPFGHPFPYRFPTPTQLRSQVYAAVIHGATGIHFFIVDSYIPRDAFVIGASPDPKVSYRKEDKVTATPTQLIQSRALWDMIVQVNRELKELTPVILSPTVELVPSYSVKVEGESVTRDPIRTLLKPDVDGGYVLFTVNLDDAVLNVTYTFPSVLASVELLHENQKPLKLNADSKSFTQTYEPFEAHLLRIAPKP